MLIAFQFFSWIKIRIISSLLVCYYCTNLKILKNITFFSFLIFQFSYIFLKHMLKMQKFLLNANAIEKFYVECIVLHMTTFNNSFHLWQPFIKAKFAELLPWQVRTWRPHLDLHLNQKPYRRNKQSLTSFFPTWLLVASRRRDVANTCTLNLNDSRILVDGGRKLPESHTADRPDSVAPLFYGESWEKCIQLSERRMKAQRNFFLF